MRLGNQIFKSMKYFFIFLFLISCSSEPSKEKLIENCADDQNSDRLSKYGKIEHAYGLWIGNNFSFKNKYDLIYKYSIDTKNCETSYENANVSFKLKYADFKTKSKDKYNNIRKELNAVEIEKLDRMIETVKTVKANN